MNQTVIKKTGAVLMILVLAGIMLTGCSGLMTFSGTSVSDETGFRILEGIQRERSSNTFAKKDAFG